MKERKKGKKERHKDREWHKERRKKETQREIETYRDKPWQRTKGGKTETKTNKERKKISMTEGERRDLSIQNRKRNGEVERDLYPWK